MNAQREVVRDLPEHTVCAKHTAAAKGEPIFILHSHTYESFGKKMEWEKIVETQLQALTYLATIEPCLQAYTCESKAYVDSDNMLTEFI